MRMNQLTAGEFKALSSHGYKCVALVCQCQIFTISHTMEAERAGAKWRRRQSSVSHNATANLCKHGNFLV